MSCHYNLMSWVYLALYLFGIAAHYTGKFLFHVGQVEFRFFKAAKNLIAEIHEALNTNDYELEA